jgi:hypothetical protein
MSKKQVWVSPVSNGGWRVHKPGDKRDITHTENKTEAINKARDIAKNQKTELRIQNKDGKISESNSYGRDPFPPRG